MNYQLTAAQWAWLDAYVKKLPGRVCRTCGGDGLPDKATPAGQAAEFCPACHGAGRIPYASLEDYAAHNEIEVVFRKPGVNGIRISYGGAGAESH